MDQPIVIVGAGFFGCVLAERITAELDLPVWVIDRRDHIGGNCYSERDSHTGIEYHKYGTHIFHTDNPRVWNYIRRFTEFNGYRHQVLTTYRNKVYQMPINLETINSFYNLNLKPYEAEEFIKREAAKEPQTEIRTFEQKAISMLGRPLYEAFIKGYTLKQWQRDPSELPADILTRLPFRTNYDESYYYSPWQGIPVDGYTAIFDRMLSHRKIRLSLNTDYFAIRNELPADSLVIYSGPIDRFFDFKLGALEWRSLKFEPEYHEVRDFQGTSCMNYAEVEIPYTRIHEPRHLHPERTYHEKRTLTIKEYSVTDDGQNPYYPINDERNNRLVKKYREEAATHPNVIMGGRLGGYKYLDMHQTIAAALDLFETEILPRYSN